jgi:hypothetical protein
MIQFNLTLDRVNINKKLFALMGIGAFKIVTIFISPQRKGLRPFLTYFREEYEMKQWFMIQWNPRHLVIKAVLVIMYV